MMGDRLRSQPRLSLTVKVAKRCHGIGSFAIAHFRFGTQTITDDFLQGITMRRMMHAAVFFLASAPLLQAQTPSMKPLPPQPVGSRSVLALSAEVHDDSEVDQEPQVQVSTQLPPQANPVPQSNPVSFIPRDSGRPYSQLAGFMSCSDWSPNLWNGYSCERAARAAVISQHVDMQCSCFDSKKNCLHNHASACGIDGCSSGDCLGGACKGKVGTKIVNRYRQSMSTLHAAPCESCGSACGTSCSSPSSVAPADCTTGACAVSTLYPNAQTQPAMGMHPSRALIATPVINHPRSAMNVQDAYPKIDSRR